MVIPSNHYCIVILLLLLKITMFKGDILEINDMYSNEIGDDASDEFDDDYNYDYSGLDINYNDDVCKLPIVIGDCKYDSRSTDGIDRFYSYNTSSRKCEEFTYDGCGNEGNRFLSVNKCWKTCYSPLSYFLARVKEKLRRRFSKFSLSAAYRRFLHFDNNTSENTI